MTDKRAYELLKNILDTVSEEEYPEIVCHVCAYIDEDEETIYEDTIIIAQEMHEADGAKQFPKCVADFMIEAYTDAMNEGNADAACDLGSLYYTGRAGEQNYAKAVEYYTVGAQRGSRQAQENLGYCYYYGRSVEKDYKKAFHYFALGAFDGHLRSLYKIGDMYRNGYYVEKNEVEAYRIYRACAESMTDQAAPLVGADVMMRLGDCYYEGIGTEIDYKLALKYYQHAENLFITRLEEGDFLIKGCYEKAVARQTEVRKAMQKDLPAFEWTE